MAQGAIARPQELSIHGLLTLFRRESPVQSGKGHLEPLPPAKGHLYHNDQPAALPEVRSRLPSRSGTPSNGPSSAP